MNATKTNLPLHMQLYVPVSIKQWSSKLLMNDKKTELIEYNSNGLKQNHHVAIGNTLIDTQPRVTNLVCVLDVDIMMSGHAARMCKSAYYHLRCIRNNGSMQALGTRPSNLTTTLHQCFTVLCSKLRHQATHHSVIKQSFSIVPCIVSLHH